MTYLSHGKQENLKKICGKWKTVFENYGNRKDNEKWRKTGKRPRKAGKNIKISTEGTPYNPWGGALA